MCVKIVSCLMVVEDEFEIFRVGVEILCNNNDVFLFSVCFILLMFVLEWIV